MLMHNIYLHIHFCFSCQQYVHSYILLTFIALSPFTSEQNDSAPKLSTTHPTCSPSRQITGNANLKKSTTTKSQIIHYNEFAIKHG